MAEGRSSQSPMMNDNQSQRRNPERRMIPKRGQVTVGIVKGLAHSVASFVSSSQQRTRSFVR